MPKRTHKSAPEQLDLLADRSKQFELMEEFEFLGTPSQVAMLCKLFIAVGKFNKKVIEIATLARRCSLSTKSAYRVKKQLEEMGLIFGKTLGGRRFEWSIGWANVWDLHEAWKQNPAAEGAEMDHVDDQETVESCLTSETSRLIGEPSRPTDETSGLTYGTTGLTGETHIRSIRSTSFSTSSSSSASVEADPAEAAKEAVMVRLMDCGVNRIGQTVDAALDNGLTIEQIHAVIDHFAAPANSGRWTPNILVERLTSPGMHLATPDRGWWGENPEWKARQLREARMAEQQQAREAAKPVAVAAPAADFELEAAHGATLDAMSQGERKALLQFAAERQIVTPFFHRSITNAGDEAHKSKLYRKTFLEALKARSNP